MVVDQGRVPEEASVYFEKWSDGFADAENERQIDRTAQTIGLVDVHGALHVLDDVLDQSFIQ